MQKPRIGISSCLLGFEVRYDGGHKRHSYIEQTLGQYFEFRAFCPEVEAGLGVPRPTLQLRETANGVRCVGVKDHGFDATDSLQGLAEANVDWLGGLCGYILKKDSPSCGMERVKVYRGEEMPRKVGVGVFAEQLQQRWPLLPLEEEGRLGDPILRENFIRRVFVLYRWRQLLLPGLTLQGLMTFHSAHKLILMSHHQNRARELGRLVAETDAANLKINASNYIAGVMEILRRPASRGNHVNVLQHIQGYLKRGLDGDDKQELVETIENYRLGQLPLIVPITLLRHHFRRQPDPFIAQSHYMSPHPSELALLNEI